MLKSLILIMLLCFVSSIEAKVHPRAGTTAFNFLCSNTGGRPVAMGGAYTAIADDIYALWYNPAGIATYPEFRVISGYRSLWAGGQAGIAGVTYPLPQKMGAVGIVATYERSGIMDATDLDGDVTSTFRAGAITMSSAYACEIYGMNSFLPYIPYAQRLQLGVSFKVIQAYIMSYSSYGAAADIGVRYSLAINKGITFGAAVQNIGTQIIAYDTETAPLPLTFRVGVSYPLQYLPLLLVYEAVKSNDRYLYHTFGGEFKLTNSLYIRGGFSSADRKDWHINDDDTFVGMVMGAGLHLNAYTIDFAYTPSGQLGSQSRFSIGRVF